MFFFHVIQQEGHYIAAGLFRDRDVDLLCGSDSVSKYSHSTHFSYSDICRVDKLVTGQCLECSSCESISPYYLSHMSGATRSSIVEVDIDS